MTDKKTRRAVALPRLHKSIEDFIKETVLTETSTIGDLLDAVQAAWFKDAKQ